MKTIVTAFISFYCILFVVSSKNYLDAASNTFLRRQKSPNANFSSLQIIEKQQTSVLCRVTKNHEITFETRRNGAETTTTKATEETSCIPILDNEKESDYIFPIDLPDDLEAQYEADIAQGKLLLSISDSVYEDNELIIGDFAKFSVVQDDKYRHLMTRNLQTNSEVTFAVVRISTPNEAPSVSVSTLSSTLFGNNGFQKQYEDCSFGHMKVINNGVFDVRISQTVAQLGADIGRILGATYEQIQIDRNVSAQELANKVLFCFPPGTGDWAANAPYNWWRAQFNNGWCTSLSAIMHEVAHLFGVPRADKDYQAYRDLTGYMGSSYTYSDWPKKCFNGQNSHHFGWFSDRQKDFDPLTDGGALVQLVSLVEYDKAPDYAFVNIAIADKYYLQYNVAEKFNYQTEDKANQVTIVEQYASGTNLVAGLSAGNEWKFSNYQGSGKTLIIRACGQGVGETGAKTMLMSIALDTSLCESYSGDTRFSTPPPRKDACFSAYNEVEVLGMGLISMGSLQIGDLVRAGNGQFSQVYSFGHLDQSMEAEFLQIYFENKHDIPLEVTSDHMIFLASGKVVRASQVQVGDIMSGKWSAVDRIQTVRRRGMYSPITIAGDLVVSGVVASSYVALLDDFSSSILNAASHSVMGMHRTLCTMDFDLCQNETYNDDGINQWIAHVVQAIRTVNQQCSCVQLAVWLSALPLLAIFVVVDHMIVPLLFVFPVLFALKIGKVRYQVQLERVFLRTAQSTFEGEKLQKSLKKS